MPCCSRQVGGSSNCFYDAHNDLLYSTPRFYSLYDMEIGLYEKHLQPYSHNLNSVCCHGRRGLRADADGYAGAIQHAGAADRHTRPADGYAGAAHGDARPADRDTCPTDGYARPADGYASAADRDTCPTDGYTGAADSHAGATDGHARSADGHERTAHRNHGADESSY
jgi:hypothetical protein